MVKLKYLIWMVVSASFLLTGFAQEFSQFNVVRFKRSESEIPLPEFLLGPDYDNPVDPNENCTLPANYTRTAVSHEANVSFSSLMNGGFDAFINSSGYQDVILVMGNTGVGKTTATQILAGDLNTIHAMYSHTGKLVIVDDAEKTSAPSIISRTLVPELVVKINNSSSQVPVAFYDCPGFDDTRGPQQDVATSFFMNQIINKVSRVKILFLILQSSVDLGHDRVDFDSMVGHATSFVKNVTDFKDSIGLVVTKVKNYNDQGNELNDTQIMRSILSFLFHYARTKHSLLRNSGTDDNERNLNAKKLEFVRILLEQDANGRYSKISFSRDPEKCGPLSDSVQVANTQRRLLNLYESLQYSSVINKTDNFGFTLKQTTKLKIDNQYLPEIHNQTLHEIFSLINNFKERFDGLGRVRIENYSTSLASDIHSVVHQVGLVLFDMVANLREEKSKNSPEKFLQLGIILQRGFNELKFKVPDNFTKFLEQQDEMIDFFEKVRGNDRSVRPINAWISSLSSLQAYVMDYKYWYEFCAQLQAILTSHDFHAKKSTFGGIQAGQANWLEFVERNNITSVGQNIKEIQTKFGMESSQVQLLNEMMVYATAPTTMSCTSNTLFVEGHFIRFSEFVEGSTGRIRFPSSCSLISQITRFTVEVYSTNTVFIDENLNGVGLEINLVLLSPKWVVVNRVNLNLDGAVAPEIYPRKANDGGEINLHEGVAGQDGLAGKPGGPAGSLYGIANTIKGGDKMTISSNGGHGSAGQNGGNGGQGSRGRDPTKDDTFRENSFDFGVVDREWRKFWGHPGYAGGKGGDGGVGGLGGYPGQIKINSLEDSSNLSVQKSQNKGSSGTGGLGGRGGKGGPPGQGMHCDTHRILGWRRKNECNLIASSLPNAADGENGHANTSRASFEMPVSSQYRIGEVKSVTNFKVKFNTVRDVDVQEFRVNLQNYLSSRV